MEKKYYEIDKKTQCWNWLGAISKYGYAIIKRNGKTQHASRYFYEQMIGKIPEKMTIDHLCYNKACVNVDHLEVVTSVENCRRRQNTKLNKEKVIKIRKLYNKGIKQMVLAKMFNVCQGHISDVVNNQRWNLSI